MSDRNISSAIERVRRLTGSAADWGSEDMGAAYREDAPVLADEVERLRKEMKELADERRRLRSALWDVYYLSPGDVRPGEFANALETAREVLGVH